MGKMNRGTLLVSFTGCFLIAAISMLSQPQILPQITPSLEALNNLLSTKLSEPVSLIFSGMGLITIASVAREKIKK